MGKSGTMGRSGTNDAPPPAPRAVPSFRKLGGFGVVFSLLFGGIWMLVGTIITASFAATSPPWYDWQLDQRGVHVVGQVESVRMTATRINRVYVRKVAVSFKDAAGVAHEGEVSTTDPRIFRMTRGETLDIDYDPQSPAVVRVTGQKAAPLGAFMGLPFAFAVIGAVIFTFGMVSLRRKRTLYRDGESASAKVTSVERTMARMNGRMVYRVAFAFGDHTGSYTTVDPPENGAAIWIIYDPRDPTKSVAA